MNCPLAPTDSTWLKLTVATVPAVIAVASAFIGVILTNRNNLNLNQQKFTEDRAAAQRKAEEEKAESGRRAIVEHGDELYELLEAWSDEIAQASGMIREHILIGLNAPAEHLLKMRESTRILRFKFLTQVYFPDLSPQMSDVGTLWLDLCRKTLDIKKSGGLKDEDLEVRKTFRIAVMKLEQAVIDAVRKNVPGADS